mmetsp:Transcript_172387/g.419227  ORF Transcript_172387/g.419227 Transcript_172387/m.419227 type:complete len:100 (+) Transcript_172387:33-332(+)
MHHMAFVRNDVLRKVMNTSNRGNYDSLPEFASRFAAWRPSSPPVHPHPYFQSLFKGCEVRDNTFGIPFVETAKGLVMVTSEVLPEAPDKKSRKKGKRRK